jgi:hypothetical protein
MDTTKAFLIRDSLVYQLEQITKHHPSNPHDLVYSALVPLVPVLIGGILALLGQFIIKRIERNNESTKLKIEIKSNISMQLCQLSFQLKDLAYFKQNTELQLIYYKLEVEEIKKRKYYDEHYKSNLNIWECEKLISSTISSIGGHLVKYQMISNLPINIQNLITTIQGLNFETAKDYSNYSEIPSDNEISKDIADLHSKFLTKVYDINQIINKILQDNKKHTT